MKKVLILIHDMQIGGAQKSLTSFCRCLAGAPAGEDYEVHLMPINPKGEFLSQIPEQIQIIQPPTELRWLGSHVNKKLLKEHFSLPAICGQVLWMLRRKLRLFPAKANIQQALWICWKSFVPKLQESYDIAVSYMDGVPNYFVMDKVQAKKKVLWVHSEYQKQGYCADYDTNYFETCDRIVTISDNCRNCILEAFPHLGEKTHILENITSCEDVVEKSLADTSLEFAGTEGLKLLSVGRLNPQKGFDMAIEVAKLLRDEGIAFRWLILGEGFERQKLQKAIDDYALGDCFQMVGARENPYVYMRRCDILVQPSRVEGKSIVLDEAKILCKPIVATNYTTVKDSIDHGNTGWVVDMTPQGIAKGIRLLWEDGALRERLCENLAALPKGNQAQLQKYIEIMF